MRSPDGHNIVEVQDSQVEITSDALVSLTTTNGFIHITDGDITINGSAGSVDIHDGVVGVSPTTFNVTTSAAALTFGANFELNLTGGTGKIKDSRGTPKGIEYDADYSANYTSRSLIDKGYLSSNYIALPSATADQTLYYTGSAWAASSIIKNNNTYVGINTAPSSSYQLYVKQPASTKGIFVERDSSSAGLALYHNGSATLESIGGLNMNLITASGSTINLLPGGGGGQIRQVAVVPINTVTSTQGNASFLGFNGTFAPTAAGGDFSILAVEGTINQTGSANGLTRGIRISPVLTAITNEFRCIDIDITNSVKGIYQSSGNLTNYFVGATSFGSTSTPSDKVEITGNLKLTTAGNKLKIPTGSNASMGTATLSSGTVTVSTTAVTSSSTIFLTYNTPSGTTGAISAPTSSIVNATSFTINSSSGSDNSTVNW